MQSANHFVGFVILRLNCIFVTVITMVILKWSFLELCLFYIPQSEGTTDGQRFVKQQHTMTILSIVGMLSPDFSFINSRGIMPSKILNFLKSNPMTRSI